MSTEKRKTDHIRVCIDKDVEFLHGNGFVQYQFRHNAMPEIDWEGIDIRTEFLGHRFRAPFFIEAITGGTNEGEKINRNLARAAQELGIGMGVGSQRAMIENPKVSSSFSVKETSPDIFLVGNIGASQIIEFDTKLIREALEKIKADALAVHLNPAQEIAQNGGRNNWKGVEAAIKRLSSELKLPVIVKEVGNGISGDVAKRLERAGVDAIDVAGAGGTSWVKVDTLITGKPLDEFFEWGIPTAEALEQCLKCVKIPVIASGGIRNGIDAAKALSLGASLVGLALPLLRPACNSPEDVKEVLEKLILELKTAMFLTGSRSLKELKGKAVKI
jgi:isopentenyl-diphosphate delta-isomerase